MATEIIEENLKIQEALIKSAEVAKTVVDNTELLRNAIEKLGTVKFDNADTLFKGFDQSLSSLSKGFGNIGDQWKEFKDNIEHSPINNNTFEQLSKVIGGLGGNFSVVAHAMSEFGGATKGAMEYITNYLQSRISALEVEQKLAQSMIANAAAIGNLDNVLKDGGDTYKSLGEKIEQTRLSILNVSNATGVQSQTLSALYGNIDRLPQAFDKAGKAISNFDVTIGGSVSKLYENILGVNDTEKVLTAVTQVATKVYGGDMSQVIKEATILHKNYNTTLTEGLEIMAREGDVSSKLHIGIGEVGSFFNAVADKVGLLGKNSEASAEILQTMGSRLEQVGVSGEKALGIVSKFALGIADLNVVQRSFLSQQSGGPGGLAGGFHISNMIRDEKFDEVAKMAEESLKKQVGGKIVTADEAEKSEVAAAQYQKQLMFVRQGPLGSLAQDENSAAKLFESFSKGTKIDGKDLANLKDKDVLLKDTMDVGHRIQTETNGLLAKINTSLQMFARGREKAGANQARSINGDYDSNLVNNQGYNENGKNRYNTNDIDSSASMERSGMMQFLQTAGAFAQRATSTGVTDKNPEQLAQSLREAQQAVQNLNLLNLNQNEKAYAEAIGKTENPNLKTLRDKYKITEDNTNRDKLKEIEKAETELRTLEAASKAQASTTPPAKAPPTTPTPPTQPKPPTYPQPKSNEPPPNTAPPPKAGGFAAAANAATEITVFIQCPRCHDQFHAEANRSKPHPTN